MELYKYTGSVAVLTVRFGKAETITLYDSYDDSVAPVRLDVRGALAEYIKKIEGTATTVMTAWGAPVSSLPPASGSFAVAVAGTPIILFRSICKEVRMEINITYKSPEHEAAFLSELQRIPYIVNPESGRINPYWGASLYLLSALTRWPELRIAVIGEDYMMFTAAKEAFNLSQNERIIVELAAAFYNASLWEMPGFEMVSGTCDTAFALILEAFRLRRSKLFYKDGEVSAEWEERK